MVVTRNYLCFDCIILREKKEKNYKDINTTPPPPRPPPPPPPRPPVHVLFSGLCCFRSMGFRSYNSTWKKYLLSINTKEGGTQNKTHVQSHVLLLCVCVCVCVCAVLHVKVKKMKLFHSNCPDLKHKHWQKLFMHDMYAKRRSYGILSMISCWNAGKSSWKQC